MHAYALTPTLGNIQFGQIFGGKLLGDHDHIHQPTILDVQVASDDYFANLATVLDSIEHSIGVQEKQLLDSVIDDLLYLQKNYRIIKR